MSTSVPAAPPRADRRLPWRRASFAALDFETTGLDYGKDAIVSFGVVPVRSGRVVLKDAVHQLVVPGVPSSAISMRIHHLLPKDLAEAPPIEVARERLRTSLHGRFVLTWFADVEVSFLSKIYDVRRRTFARRTIDVAELAFAVEGRRNAPGLRHSLSAVAERFGVPVASPHEALDDALVTAQLFLVLAAKLERRGFGSVRSYLALTKA